MKRYSNYSFYGQVHRVFFVLFFMSFCLIGFGQRGGYEEPCLGPGIEFRDNNLLIALATIIDFTIDDQADDIIICPDDAEKIYGVVNLRGKNITNLEGLQYFPNITGLDLDNNTNLEEIDFSKLPPNIDFLTCRNTKITNLRVPEGLKLTQLSCNDNKYLESLNVANGFNKNLTLDATNNPKLTCIQHDEDFNPVSDSGWRKDAGAVWSTDCKTEKEFQECIVNVTYQEFGGDITLYVDINCLSKRLKKLCVKSNSTDWRCQPIIIENGFRTNTDEQTLTFTNEFSENDTDIVYRFTVLNEEGKEVNLSEIELSSLTEESSLPIQLSSFNVKPSNDDAIINWSTATEINNSYFNVQRSFDGQDFETIGEVAGKGNSNDEQSYSFKDFNVGQNYSTVYYRLEQVDFDGTTETFDAQSVTFKNNNSFSIYPNPSTTGQSVTVNGENINSVAIYNVVGKQILQKNYNDQSSINLDTSVLVQGIYVIVINGTQKQKLIIQ